MPYQVPLERRLRREGWKAKIYDREGPEAPHVTILRGTKAWRVGLRDKTFLVPPGGSWNEIAPAVKEAIDKDWDNLVTAWNMGNPFNPVKGEDDE